MSSAKKGNPMQRKRFLGALAAAFCALFSLALFAQVALAAGGNTLTVGIADESYLSDVTSKESLVADVYKVASAKYDELHDTYTYTMVGGFSSLQSKLDSALNGTGDWTTLCDASVEAAKSSTPAVQGHVIAGSGAGSISLADDGIYLVLAHGKSKPLGSTKTNGTKYNYSFQASLVALPTKYDENGQMSGTIRTDDAYGEWHNEASIILKWSMKPVEKPDEPDEPDEPDKPSKPSKPTTPTTPTKKVVRTGDEDHLFPFYVAMAVSGGLFVVLAAKSIREKRGSRSN